MHGKAAHSDADVVMLDLEDSVPPDKKVKARTTVIKSLADMDWGRKTVAVRVNACDTRFAYKDVIHVVEAAGQRIDVLVIPKVNCLKEIHFFSCLLDGIQMEKNMTQDIRIQASIETAQGLEAVSSIAGGGRRLHSLVFGIADYSASIGVGLTSVSGHGESDDEHYPGHRWHYPISKMVAAAKANNLLAIDATYGDFKNLEGLRQSAAMAHAMGCDGKWVIHPAQIDTVNQVFTPSEQEIARARAIIEAVDIAEISGRGAIAIEGKMVDQATVRLARLLWEQASHLGLV
ncbi:beta-methylmalyl-CoA/L-malyl-CoA lyase [Desulfocicer vacuolatum DSM 3385]|uniref:Beta-methylmalyl-CoA/L-malyl-CoA lyase n=2 Tax=Desulfocicer vacuolatum TaxID=2298 RepID=A0A1W2BPH7_9BACT|nr:beta-methylmalyl-CoA/L-malyl-CoA lyase [Desulfocicer vacuolatum DSM 3385]